MQQRSDIEPRLAEYVGKIAATDLSSVQSPDVVVG